MRCTRHIHKEMSHPVQLAVKFCIISASQIGKWLFRLQLVPSWSRRRKGSRILHPILPWMWMWPVVAISDSPVPRDERVTHPFSTRHNNNSNRTQKKSIAALGAACHRNLKTPSFVFAYGHLEAQHVMCSKMFGLSRSTPVDFVRVLKC